MSILISNTSNCKSCFKCLRECVVKSIEYKNDLAKVVENECILCGKCIEVCHQKAKTYRKDIDKVFELLENNNKVIASIAPSFACNFDVDTFEEFKNNIKKLGFFDCEETIHGAKIVNQEYEKIIEESNQNVFLVSSCPTIVKYVSNYHPDLKDYLFKVVSPMTAHARLIKSKIPDAKVVFIGPCISKKEELTWENDVDFTITFEELEEMLLKKNILIKCFETKVNLDSIKNKLTLYPGEGGVLKSLSKSPNYTYISSSRIKKVKNILDNISVLGDKKLVLELNACEGSCLGGPGNISKNYVLNQIRLYDYYTKNNFAFEYEGKKVDLARNFEFEKKLKRLPTEEEIRNILKLIGKPNEKSEVNCGSCGYSSCKEKASAVYYNKADLNMCLPYLKERAESIASKVMDNIPMGIICLNEKLDVIEINKQAKEIFDISYYRTIKNIDVSTLIDLYDIIICQNECKNIYNKKVFLQDLNKYIEMSIINNLEQNFIFLIIEDVTKTVIKNNENSKIKLETLEIADRVIKKQMEVVQEIASLLGETAAETKIALTKLKKSVDIK